MLERVSLLQNRLRGVFQQVQCRLRRQRPQQSQGPKHSRQQKQWFHRFWKSLKSSMSAVMVYLRQPRAAMMEPELQGMAARETAPWRTGMCAPTLLGQQAAALCQKIQRSISSPRISVPSMRARAALRRCAGWVGMAQPYRYHILSRALQRTRQGMITMYAPNPGTSTSLRGHSPSLSVKWRNILRCRCGKTAFMNKRWCNTRNWWFCFQIRSART